MVCMARRFFFVHHTREGKFYKRNSSPETWPKAEPSSEILILTTESTTESQRLRMDMVMELGGGTREGVPRGLVG
jgi:hypothetical protein